MSLDAPPTEAQLPRRVEALVRDRLPAKWCVSTLDQPRAAGDRGADAVFTVTAPDGSELRVVVECKRNLVTRDLPALVMQVRKVASALPGTTAMLVASPYLSPPVRAWLTDNDISYADATGNLRLTSSAPALFIRDRGADTDPWRGPGRPRGTLKGAPAAVVARALIDYYPPTSMRTLIERSGASTGAAYRVVDFLDEEALITRGPRGEVASVEWSRLLRRWAEDYSFSGAQASSGYLQPRGLTALVKDLPRLGQAMNYAVTGSLAAQQWAPYAPARLAMLYIEDIATAGELLSLRAVDAGGNVLLAAPTSDVVFQRTQEVDGVRYAAPAQVVVDLLGGPGRNPAEGEELLAWMERDESTWRQQPPGSGA